MTPHQILIVAVRLVAILWFFHAVAHASNLLTFVSSSGFDESQLPLVWGLATVELIVCVVLWLFPATLARWLLPGGDTPTPAPVPALLDWQTMAVITIGIWVLSQAIPDLVYWATVFGISTSDARFTFAAENKAHLVALFARVVVGFWLVFGARGFAAMLFRIRTAGLKS